MRGWPRRLGTATASALRTLSSATRFEGRVVTSVDTKYRPSRHSCWGVDGDSVEVVVVMMAVSVGRESS